MVGAWLPLLQPVVGFLVGLSTEPLPILVIEVLAVVVVALILGVSLLLRVTDSLWRD